MLGKAIRALQTSETSQTDSVLDTAPITEKRQSKMVK